MRRRAVRLGLGLVLAMTAAAPRPAGAAPPPGLFVDAGGRAASIAHRGASGDAPENTLAALELALDQGSNFIEADVQRTSDGTIVVVHDETLMRTTNVRKVFPRRRRAAVGSFTLAQLRRLDAGSWNDRAYAGQRIPTLDELLAVMRPPTGLIIELKKPARYPGIEAQLARQLAAADSPYLRWARDGSKLMVASIDAGAVRRYRRVDPDAVLGVLKTPSASSDATLRDLAGFADFVGTGEGVFRRATVDRIHDLGLDVLSATSTAAQMQVMTRRGIDGVMTDYPGRMVDVTADVGSVFAEGESLSRLGANAAVVRRTCCMTGGKWSGEADLHLRGTRKGARMTLQFDVPRSGTYDVSAVLGKGRGFGIAQLSIDGNPAGEPFDGYRPGMVRSTVRLGQLALDEGPHTLTIQVVGRHHRSSGYEASIDVLELRPDR